MTDAIVIGGGIAGLASATLLAHAGADVVLLERHDQPGGRAGLLEIDGFRFDTGPSWYFMTEVVDHYFALLGERTADHLDLRDLDPSYRVFTEPADHTGPRPFDIGPPEQIAAQVEALEPGSSARVERYLRGAGDAYRIAVERFLYTTFQRPLRSLNAEALLKSPTLIRLLGSTLAHHVSRTATDERLQQVLSYHAVFLGSSPYRVPALYSLMSHLDLAQPVRYPVGGMYAVIEAMTKLAVANGVQIRTGADVARISVTGDREHRRATGVELHDGERLSAPVVVSTADLHHTETELLSPQDATYPARYWKTRGPGVSALLVYAGVRGEVPELAHHSLFFTRDWPANFDAVLGPGRVSPVDSLRAPVPGSLYLSRTSATDRPGTQFASAPEGHEALVLLVPFPADPRWGSAESPHPDLDTMADTYLDQVAEWSGIPDLRARIVTRRVVGPGHFAEEFSAWRGGALGMEHTLRQSAMFRPRGMSRRVRGLYYAGASVAPGIGVPMCLISAELVLKRLLGDTSATPLPTPAVPGSLRARIARGRR